MLLYLQRRHTHKTIRGGNKMITEQEWKELKEKESYGMYLQLLKKIETLEKKLDNHTTGELHRR